MAYDRDRSAHTIVAITETQLEQFLETARAFRHETWFRDVNAGELVEFLYLTGAHPIVIADPVRSQLRATAEPDGFLHVRWSRAKKRGMKAEMDLPIATLEHPAARWIPRFIVRTRERPYSTRRINDLFLLLSKLSGIPVSPRTLRHTQGVDTARKSRDPAVVAWRLNCSVGTAYQYLRVAGSSDPRILALALGSDVSPLSRGASSS